MADGDEGAGEALEPAFEPLDAGGDVAEDVAVIGPGVGVGLRKGETELKDKINAAIKAIRDNGTYDTFSKKYFDFDIYGG